MSALIDGLKALGSGRPAALAAVGLSLFALLAILATHDGGGGRMAVLYADLDLREAAQIADQLTAQHIAHEVSPTACSRCRGRPWPPRRGCIWCCRSVNRSRASSTPSSTSFCTLSMRSIRITTSMAKLSGRMASTRARAAAPSSPASEPMISAAPPAEPPISEALRIDMIRLELGYGLLVLAGGEPATAGERASLLAWHGVPGPLARKLRAGPLPFALSACLRFAALPLEAGAAPLLMAGPPGAGKTLTVARLATRLVLAGSTPLVVTADARRAGSAEQLAAFTRLLGLELLAAGQPASLARAVARRQRGAPVLIDAPGIDPLDRGEQAMLAALAEAAGATPVAVLPGGLDPGEAGEMAAALAGVGARLLVAPRFDLARRLGSVLATAAVGLALTELGVGPGAADGLVPATPARLAQGLQAAQPPGAEPFQEMRA